MPEHNVLTGSQLHEIKGAAAASSGQVPIADGNGAAPFGVPPWATKSAVKYKDGDTVRNNTTTLANDDDLVGFSLAAASVYKIEGDLYVSSPDSTSNMKSSFQLVSGSVASSQIFYTAQHPDGNNVVSSGEVAITDTVTLTSVSGTAPVHVRLSGYVSITNAAVFNLQIAQVAAAASDTALLQGSNITFTLIE